MSGNMKYGQPVYDDSANTPLNTVVSGGAKYNSVEDVYRGDHFHDDHDADDDDAREMTLLTRILGPFILFLILAFSAACEYNVEDFQVNQYIFYLDVTIMMLVGFGFLMTFQRFNALTAVGVTFLITCICIPLGILTGRFFASVGQNNDYPELLNVTTSFTVGNPNLSYWPKIGVDLNAFLNGNFAAAAVLISFGAVLGKLTVSQVAVMAILETILYSFNKEILCIHLFDTLDMGGTIFIHLFGAYFGLALSWVLGHSGAHEHSEPSRVSDILSLIGTVFLWIYWPSFNGATAPLGSNQQSLTTVNTVMALLGSCLSTFFISAWCNKRLAPVDIQNATLAGGVCIGASSNLLVTPGASLGAGVVAGIVSALGYNKLQSKLEDVIDLHDSCGVHNLHGMPAILGSIVVTIATSIKSTQGTVEYPRGNSQPLAQAEGALITLGFALTTGLIVGKLLKCMPKNKRPYMDAATWTVSDNKTL